MKPRIRISLQVTGLLIFLLLSVWWGRTIPVVAQSDIITWSRPVNLSNTRQVSAHPVVIADDYGYVHVLWSERMGGEPVRPGDTFQNNGNTILYTRWDGTTWTPPIDVLFVPGQDMAEWPAVDLDAENRLHVIWTSLSNVYYSNAPSWKADSAHAWTKPVILASDSSAAPWGSDILADASGNLHVVYTVYGNGAGVYYIDSTDGGMSWRYPIQLSQPLSPLEELFSMVKIIADGSGRLHAVWATNQAEGFGQAVYHARSVDGGNTWSAPVQLGYRDPDDYEVAWPYLTAIGAAELHLVYVDGPGMGSRGRFHRISKDGGQTWSAPYHILTDMVGVNGYVVPIVDGAGQMHLIIDMRTSDTQTVGIYYARWQGSGWSPVEPVDVSSPAAPSAHYTAAAVRLGNKLHLVYNQHATGEIWHTWGLIPSVNQSAALELPPRETPAPSPLRITEISSPTPTPTPRLVRQSMNGTTPFPPPAAMGYPLVSGIGVAFVLIAGVIVWTWIRSR